MNKFKEVFCEILIFLREPEIKNNQTHMQYIQSRVSGQTVKYLFIWEHIRHVTQTLTALIKIVLLRLLSTEKGKKFKKYLFTNHELQSLHKLLFHLFSSRSLHFLYSKFCF